MHKQRALDDYVPFFAAALAGLWYRSFFHMWPNILLKLIQNFIGMGPSPYFVQRPVKLGCMHSSMISMGKSLIYRDAHNIIFKFYVICCIIHGDCAIPEAL
jgi:hypothetical protein